MQYSVGLYFSSASQEADLKDTVRASDIEDAITVFMKGRNIKYAYAACVYPASKSVPVRKEWRWHNYCSVSGRMSMQHTEKRQ